MEHHPMLALETTPHLRNNKFEDYGQVSLDPGFGSYRFDAFRI